MKKIVTGIMASVDSGKTTLSEAMLYISGSIRKLGRVDHKDAFLDTYALERARGITIFSKQAELTMGDLHITLLDTPGHVDFSAEMERTLQVIDYAILVISGADGVQGHTKTLWRLLEKYEIPVFLFVNKMDQNGVEKCDILRHLQMVLSDGCIDFSSENSKDAFFESIAMCDEHLLENYLLNGEVENEEICRLIRERKVFPCYFGSALKLQGVEEFLKGIEKYTSKPIFPDEFGAKVFKITRDEQDNRLTYMKITGGSLKVKDIITNEQEKVNQIRIYSGTKYTTVNEIKAGNICAVTGLTKTRPGEGLGIEEASAPPILIPVLNYQILLPEGMDAARMLPKFKQLEEEIPELHITWEEKGKEIHARVMGEVQTEVLKCVVQERFGTQIEFGQGRIVYKETIDSIVEGIGHFEPLRHYAEVHLLMEPLERGSGLEFVLDCSEDILDRNWQRLILTHLEEKEHIGVLTGSAITDMRITLITGRAHQKHTEGGDFRQATYRAVRNGLKKASSILLEPYFDFRLELPEQNVGRAMADLDQMNGTFELNNTDQGYVVITGYAPVSTIQNYQKEITSYTKGEGKLTLEYRGYEKCHNETEVIESIGYDSERDLDNPTGSVFCAHGSGFLVNWDEVEQYMHLEGIQSSSSSTNVESTQREVRDEWIDTDEIDSILERTFYSNRGKKATVVRPKRRWESVSASVVRNYRSAMTQEEYLLVDGYNVVFSNDELSQLANENMDAASGKLMDILCNYQGIRGCRVLLVFDAYRIKGHQREVIQYHNIQVVYTKEAETADQFIEKFAHENAQKFRITVATSDRVEQIIIRSKGCALLSARDLWKEIDLAKKENKEIYERKNDSGKNYLLDHVDKDIANELDKIRKDKKQHHP